MKLNKLIYSVLGIFALSSCADNMEYKEYSNYDANYVKRTFGDVGGLVSNIYQELDTDFGNYSGAVLGSATDEAEYAYTGNSIEYFYNGSWSPTNAQSSMWTACYKAIADCNLYLEEFTGLTFSDYEQISDYKAEMYRYNNYQYEVRFLRAYFYFNLVRQYGDVPFTDHVLSTSEVNSLTRTPAQDIFDYIISECDAIKNDIIPDYTKLGDLMPSGESTETGRANKRAVLALKARTALYAASPLFNPDNNKELWYRAATASKELIDACDEAKMKLISEYETLWSATSYNDAIDELIFGKRASTGTNSFEKYNFPIGLENCKGGNCPTQTLVDAYEFQATGLRPDETTGYDKNQPYYEGRDPRFEKTIAKNGDTKWPNWNETALETYTSGANGEPLSGGTPTSYYLKKYCQAAVNTTSASASTSYHTWITFRLGEFYLNYAEALFKYFDNPYTKDPEFGVSANDMVNKTRIRVKMPEFPTGMTNANWWKKYKNERMVELAFEGHRFWDVRRWKEADTYFKSIDEMKITKNSDGSFKYTRNTVSRQWDDKMYLFPIPQSERGKNPNLVQNLGW
ncbi:RagB/SusD family nutrient uptake outer membrane protein [Bacteroides sp.]|uniref:RagB/SusD family nutrient uptake outer membrane protein n=1 Tax=Bacteroides sp. TaxID=29523 RepID=UPI002A7EE1C7|nr:RagB/SusD family nutrient uptake outer membrane protein [Bacteroides sp.]